MTANVLHAITRRRGATIGGIGQMGRSGFTRASTLGPIADVVTAAGGSIGRVFRRADLPCGLLDSPDALVPLREHFKLLSVASRELQDELFSARLGRQVTLGNLGVYGKWVTQAACLHEAIHRADTSLPHMMQSATRLILRLHGRQACWSYEIADTAYEGRQQNEMLALSYMIAVVRCYAGVDWAPHTVVVCGTPVQMIGALEDVLRANVVFRDQPSAIIFDRTLLATVHPSLGVPRTGLSAEDLDRAFDLPDPDDLVANVSALIRLELLDQYPKLARIGQKSGMTTRTLQRQLQTLGVRFSDLVQDALQRRARSLLRHTDQTVTEIAALLGYNDAAHFTRAFERWSGTSPSVWRSRN
jgi:AraC-like DNA-binding protein